jgi:hypothetical protein
VGTAQQFNSQIGHTMVRYYNQRCFYFDESMVVVACNLTWQNMQAYQAITNNTCPNINAQLLLVSTLN